MNGKYREAKVKNRSRYYILLSIVFVGVLLKWGIPLFLNIISSPSSNQTNPTFSDNVPPQVPVISALPEATNSSRIKVEGYSEKEADIEMFINDVLSGTTKTDENGAFVLDGTLEKGDNRLYVTAKDAAGNTSQAGVQKIIYDDKPLEVIITSPKEGTEYFGPNSQTVDVKGTVSKANATVIVNGSYSTVDKEGNYNQRILLSNGENKVTVKATDRAGNVTELSIKIVYNP